MRLPKTEILFGWTSRMRMVVLRASKGHSGYDECLQDVFSKRS